MAVDGEAIVLAEEQHRHFHERGEIQAFVIDALLGRTIAEDCDRETIDTAPLEAERGAHRMRDRAGHHGRRSHQPDLGRREVHRARLAARNATLAAVQLGEHGVQSSALGDVEAVRAIGRENEVVGAQPIANADRDRLLADRQMDRALDLVGRIELDDPFLDEPDQQRRPEQPAIDRFILHRQMLPGSYPWRGCRLLKEAGSSARLTQNADK